VGFLDFRPVSYRILSNCEAAGLSTFFEVSGKSRINRFHLRITLVTGWWVWQISSNAERKRSVNKLKEAVDFAAEFARLSVRYETSGKEVAQETTSFRCTFK
jgi:hypothetical protein